MAEEEENENVASGKDNVERWPDGTPKAHQGAANAWKNWINFDSGHDELTDRLNRRRHFFWEVDARGATSQPGIFAAGDVTTVPYKQIVIAMGEGSKASLSAFDHLIRAGA